MTEIVNRLFDSQLFMPHGHCYLWRPEILWLNVVSDGLIALAYYMIPGALLYFAFQRRELPFIWIFVLFGAFILACGTTHVMDIWTVWNPNYGVEGIIKLVTAAISLSTALLLIPLMPKALALRSPTELEGINAALENEIGERQGVEAALRQARDELETRVQQRTAELSAAMRRLEQEIATRRENEAEIRRLNAELEQRVAQRTAQLEAANQELEGFSYSVSHDLRAPLRAIDGFAQILEEDCAEKLDDEGRRVIAVIRDNSRKMGQLIDDILAFSRLGRAALASVAIDMTALARGVFAQLQADAPNDRVRFQLTPLAPARGDPAMIRQVWVNLLHNALKFSGSRAEPVIEVGTDASATEAIYYVKDNGVGFEMQYYDKLFGVFQRLHSSNEFPGTGVGLAIVQRVIARHGGRVWAESETGKGATFYFALPKGGDHERL